MVKVSKDIRKCLRVNIGSYIKQGNNSKLTLENIFTNMDTSGDKKISKNEILAFFEKENVTKGFSKEQMLEFDAALDEFQDDINVKLNTAQKYKKLNSPQDKIAYQEDMNTITMDEITSYIKKLTSGPVKNVLGRIFLGDKFSSLKEINPRTSLEDVSWFVDYI